MTYEIQQTKRFSHWLVNIRDMRAKIAIARRIDRAMSGNFGDVRFLGESVSEMRIDAGPGYRVYFTFKGAVIVVLLAGGDKSTQVGDIQLAKKLAKDLKHD